MKAILLRLSRKTAREVRDISAGLGNFVGVEEREEVVAMRKGSALFCAVATVSENGQRERSGDLSLHVKSGKN